MDNVGSLTRTHIHTQTSLFSLSLPPSLILDVLHKTSGMWGVLLFFLCFHFQREFATQRAQQ